MNEKVETKNEKKQKKKNKQIVAVLSEKIKALEGHFKKNKQDKRAKRDLKKMKDQRRRIFKYLKGSNPKAYYHLLQTYGITDEIVPLSLKRTIPSPLRLDQIVEQ
jgi:ribosomal protein S15